MIVEISLGSIFLMNRKVLIALVLVLSSLPSDCAIARNSDFEYDVIVIGAGISGLAAAKTVEDAGLRTVVIEARDRIGGRIHSIEAETPKSRKRFFVELGASWIHGEKNNPITNLAKTAGVEVSTKKTDYDNANLYHKGNKLQWDRYEG